MSYYDTYSSYKDDKGTSLYNTTYHDPTYGSTMTHSYGTRNGDDVHIKEYHSGSYGAREVTEYNNKYHTTSTYKSGYSGK